MSQEKVAKYKEEKLNRKSIMKKQKRVKFIRSSVTAIICVAIVGWIGYSAVDFYQTNKPKPAITVDYDAIDSYMDSVSE